MVKPETQALTQQKVIAELTRSSHKDLDQYAETGIRALRQDAEFFAHLIAWNEKNGSVRDSKVALPMLALSYMWYVGTTALIENAQAHMSLLDPRNLARALAHGRKLGVKNRRVRPVVERYLREREKSQAWWDKTALQHRESLKHLYSWFHFDPSPRAKAVLFERHYPAGSVFEIVKQLGGLDPVHAAGLVAKHKIPFLIAMGALGPKLKEDQVVLATIQSMSPTELVTNMAFLEKLGVRTKPALRSALEDALGKAAQAKPKKEATFKATRAQEAVKDAGLKAKLGALQQKQIEAQGVDGNWLVLADKSGSMAQAIEAARHVAGALAAVVKGRVRLCFFDVAPRALDVTGKTYEEIKRATRSVMPAGGTSIGCGLLQAIVDQFPIDGIAVVSDAAENTPPFFANEYERYSNEFRQVPVYLYRVGGTTGWTDRDLAESMRAKGLDMQEFDLNGHKLDYYSIPNLVQTMRTNRYSLVQEVFDTPLLTLDQVYG